MGSPGIRAFARYGWAAAALAALTACSARRPDADFEAKATLADPAAAAVAQQARAEADARFHVTETASGVIVGRSPLQRFGFELRREGVSIGSDDGRVQLSFATSGVTCGGSKLEPSSVSEPRKSARARNRGEYQREIGGVELTEWFVNGLDGLEQGFTLASSPCPAGTSEMEIAVDVQGLEPMLPGGGDGSTVVLRDDRGNAPVRVTDLTVVDAAGRALRTSFRVEAGQIRMRISLAGAAWPIVVDPTWSLQAVLIQPDPAVGDGWGITNVIDGDTAVVGAHFQNNSLPGAAYVYARNGTTWPLQQKLVPSDGASADHFGAHLALAGDTLLVGSYSDDVGSNIDQGSVYVFVRSGTTWTQQAKLVASDGAALDNFGTSVGLVGDTALIGASNDDIGANANQGSVYVFVRSGVVWTEKAKLVASDATANDYFGNALAVQATTAVIGAYGEDGGGAAYVFVGSGASWSQQTKLETADAVSAFGMSVGVHADTAIVGAPYPMVSGAAYVFVRSGVAWSQQAKLQPPDIYNGQAVAVNGDLALVGNSGTTSFYPFVRSGTTWTIDDQKSGATTAIAALAMTSKLAISGNAVFALVGKACSSSADCATGFCVDSVCCNTACASACDVCSAAAGASKDGICTVVPAGSAGSPACGTLACNGVSASCVACTTDSECPANRYCDAGGNCQLRKAQAAACNLAAAADCMVADCRACQSNNCVDGYCCDTACSAACDVCSLSLGAPANGTCGPAATGVNTADCLAPQACNGTTVGCPAGCADDADCATTQYCAADDTCKPRKTQGSGCNPAAGVDCKLGGCRVCQSNNCVDGYCCNTGCTQVCAACNLLSKEGTCSALADGTTPDSPGCSGYLCDGSLLTCPSTCASGADCIQPAYYCSAPSCQPSGCTSDAGCTSDRYCASDGQCKLRKVQASACNAAAGGDCLVAGCRVCDTNNCVDGFCCNTGCTETCGACNLTTKEGTCSAVADGTLPGAPGCSGYLCNGTSATCASSCVNDGDCASTHYCSGNQCLPKACTSDTGCATTHYCAADGNCKLRKGQGNACNAAAGADCNELGCRVCVSNYCVDGFCCNTACSEPCGACNTSGQQGACAGVPDGTVPGAPGCSGYLCGGALSCPSSCGGDGDCASTHYCSGSQCLLKACASDTGCAASYYCAADGNCKPRKGQGSACNVAAGADCSVLGCRVCQSNYCVDGFCCNTACSEPCATCGASGQQGACAGLPDGTPPEAPGCNGYVCGGAITCPSSCAGDGDCASTHFCAAGACVLKKAAGEACTASSQCGDPSFPHCADGVCCNTTCTGDCMACAAANKQNGTAGGTCDAAKQGTNPNNGCILSSDPCGEQASCSGAAGQCAKAPYGKSCGPTSCAGATTVSGKICDGTGVCIDQTNAQCAPYVCKSGACASPCATDVDCATGFYCSSGTCVAQSANGKACSAATQCTSGFCVDAVCCDAPCGAQCQACAEVGTVGQCKTVSGAPRGTRPQCNGSGACAGSCDGANPTACTYPGASQTCAAAQCTGDVAQPAGACDATGGCAIPSTKNCAPYGCESSAGSCKTTCASNADCSQGATCNTSNGQCTTGSASCQDAFTVKLANGQTQSCVPYKCVGGACQQQCSTAGDCAPGHDCQSSSCVVTDAGSDGSAGAGGSGGAGGSAGAATGGSSTGGSSTGGSSTGGSSTTGGTSSGGADAGPGTGGATSGGGAETDEGGCGCRAVGERQPLRPLALIGLLSLWALRRKRGKRPAGEDPGGLTWRASHPGIGGQ